MCSLRGLLECPETCTLEWDPGLANSEHTPPPGAVQSNVPFPVVLYDKLSLGHGGEHHLQGRHLLLRFKGQTCPCLPASSCFEGERAA